MFPKDCHPVNVHDSVTAEVPCYNIVNFYQRPVRRRQNKRDLSITKTD